MHKMAKIKLLFLIIILIQPVNSKEIHDKIILDGFLTKIDFFDNKLIKLYYKNNLVTIFSENLRNYNVSSFNKSSYKNVSHIYGGIDWLYTVEKGKKHSLIIRNNPVIDSELLKIISTNYEKLYYFDNLDEKKSNRKIWGNDEIVYTLDSNGIFRSYGLESRKAPPELAKYYKKNSEIQDVYIEENITIMQFNKNNLFVFGCNPFSENYYFHYNVNVDYEIQHLSEINSNLFILGNNRFEVYDNVFNKNESKKIIYYNNTSCSNRELFNSTIKDGYKKCVYNEDIIIFLTNSNEVIMASKFMNNKNNPIIPIEFERDVSMVKSLEFNPDQFYKHKYYILTVKKNKFIIYEVFLPNYPNYKCKILKYNYDISVSAIYDNKNSFLVQTKDNYFFTIENHSILKKDYSSFNKKRIKNVDKIITSESGYAVLTESGDLISWIFSENNTVCEIVELNKVKRIGSNNMVFWGNLNGRTIIWGNEQFIELLNKLNK